MKYIRIYIYLYFLWFLAISACLALPGALAVVSGVDFKEIIFVFLVCSTIVFFTDMVLIYLFERAARKGSFEKKNYELHTTKSQRIWHFLLLGKYTHKWRD